MTEAALLDIAIDRLVRAFNPLRVILFGSRARGDARKDSDFDLLVVLDEAPDRRAAAVDMRRALRDLPIAKDIIVATPADLRARGKAIGSVLRAALREGRVLFERC